MWHEFHGAMGVFRTYWFTQWGKPASTPTLGLTCVLILPLLRTGNPHKHSRANGSPKLISVRSLWTCLRGRQLTHCPQRLMQRTVCLDKSQSVGQHTSLSRRHRGHCSITLRLATNGQHWCRYIRQRSSHPLPRLNVFALRAAHFLCMSTLCPP